MRHRHQVPTRRAVVLAIGCAAMFCATPTAQQAIPTRTPVEPAPSSAPAGWLELAPPPDGGGDAAIWVRSDGATTRRMPAATVGAPAGISPNRQLQCTVAADASGRTGLAVRRLRTTDAEAGDPDAVVVELRDRHVEPEPQWSPDSASLFVRAGTDRRSPQLVRIAVPAGTREALTEGPATVRAFRLAPDGSQIALDRARPRPAAERDPMRPFVHAITVLDLASRTERTLVDDATTVEFAWSPDGRTLVCGCDATIAFVDVASGTVAHRLATDSIAEAAYAHGARQFVWCPDGSAVACRLLFLGQTMSFDGSKPKLFGDDELFVVRPDGTATVIAPPRDAESRAAWNPTVRAWRRLPG